MIHTLKKGVDDMTHKLIRAGLMLCALSLYFTFIFTKGDIASTIGFILMVALLLMSMEGVKRKRDMHFTMQSQIEQIDRMEEEAFVYYVAELFKRMGYYIKSVKDKREGTDFMIRKGTHTICVRCGIKGMDSLMLLREVYGSKNYYKANKCLLVVNGVLDEKAKTFAEANHVQTIDRAKLIQTIAQVVQKQPTSETALEGLFDK